MRAAHVVSAFALALLVLGLPEVAHACPSCFSGNEANRIAYIVTFVILTVLPLACIGGVIYWYVKKVAAAEAAEAELVAELEE
jgi:hypothetical protein